MMGKVVNMMKRWWITVLVFTCALSLTSCSKKKTNQSLQGAEGFTQCDTDGNGTTQGAYGSFDVWVYASGNGMYELYVTPVQIADGSIADIYIGHGGGYKPLLQDVILNSGESVFAGNLSALDVQNYPVLSITPNNSSQPFGTSTPARGNYCYYNLPGTN